MLFLKEKKKSFHVFPVKYKQVDEPDFFFFA